MKIGIAVFAYCRNYHLQQVLEGLRKNDGVKELYIFQDGLRCEADREGWFLTRKVIEGIDWCSVRTFFSEKNKGLADSIVDGVNTVFRENDAIIVLEDDCVPHPAFTGFMKQSLEKYKDILKVHSVSGYSWPIEIESNGYDAYFCGRISSWGWGTWKDRWETYDRDYTLIKKLKDSCEKSRELAIWGNDLEQQVVGNVTGRANSWAVFWALNAILKEGACLSPYRSLIKNVGLDGSGVHCGITDKFQVEMERIVPDNFQLPERVEIMQSTETAFVELYGSFTAVASLQDIKEDIIVYGLGGFFKQNEKSIDEKYNVNAFIDRGKTGWIAGKKVISITEIANVKYNKILIMVQNIQECIEIVQELLKVSVPCEKILLGHKLYGQYKKEFLDINVTQDGKLALKCKDGIDIKITSLDEFYNVREVFVEQSYYYNMSNDKRDIIIDIGMNVGDSALYFLHNPNVEKVYAYEPFKKTFLMAKENLKEYLANSERIEMFQYGISNHSEKRRIGYNEGMSCGQSSIAEIRSEVYASYLSMDLVRPEDELQEEIEVREASGVLAGIVSRHSENNIILKMDCEGEEYGIIENLANSSLLGKINLIMMEWHYKGRRVLEEYLTENGFVYWCNDKSSDMGVIYAYNAKRE